MIFFVTFRQINDRIRELAAQTGEEPDLNYVMLDLYRRGQSLPAVSNHDLIRRLGSCDTAEFLREKENLYIECNSTQLEYMLQHPGVNRSSGEVLALDDSRKADLFLNFRFPQTTSRLHPHPSFFEIDYIFAGAFTLTFEHREYLLRPGDLCIISPNARHMIREAEGVRLPADLQGAPAADAEGRVPEEFVIQQYLDNDALHSTFISLLSADNIVSNFFKDILTNKNCSNFLLLSAGESENFTYIQRIARDIFLEQFKYDNYAPSCNNNLLQMLFSNVLRSYRNSFQLYSGSTDIDFVPVLKYLEQNYRTTSLAETARMFHYSPSHLSSCIKQITGKTYTEMIRNLKMSEASNYLIHSGKSIDEISGLVGYKTVDHFSRAFRQYYGMPPSQYRRENRRE